MYYDVNCPSCGAGNNICHDDGQGYDEDVRHEQGCNECGYEFHFLTSMSFSYEVYCKDEDHDMEDSPAPHKGLFHCTKCEHYEVRDKELLK